MKTSFLYPGDDVVCKAVREALGEICAQRGMTLEEAEERARALSAQRDRTRSSRALGLAIKEAREQRQISRQQLSRSAGLALRKLILIERGFGRDLPITDFFRISCALGVTAESIVKRYEEIETNMTEAAHVSD